MDDELGPATVIPNEGAEDGGDDSGEEDLVDWTKVPCVKGGQVISLALPLNSCSSSFICQRSQCILKAAGHSEKRRKGL